MHIEMPRGGANGKRGDALRRILRLEYDAKDGHEEGHAQGVEQADRGQQAEHPGTMQP